MGSLPSSSSCPSPGHPRLALPFLFRGRRYPTTFGRVLNTFGSTESSKVAGVEIPLSRNLLGQP